MASGMFTCCRVEKAGGAVRNKPLVGLLRHALLGSSQAALIAWEPNRTFKADDEECENQTRELLL